MTVDLFPKGNDSRGPRVVIARSRMRPVRAALALAAVVAAAIDMLGGRNPLTGATMPLALAAGWSTVHDLTVPRPYLTYARGLRTRSSGAVAVPPDGLWCVEFRNAGDAIARLANVTYFATTVDGHTVRGPDALNLRATFDTLGVTDDRDYLLVRYTPGAAFAAGAEHTLLELPLTLAKQFTRLGVTLEYTGPFGERRALTVDTIPPHGLPPNTSTEDPARIRDGGTPAAASAHPS